MWSFEKLGLRSHQSGIAHATRWFRVSLGPDHILTYPIMFLSSLSCPSPKLHRQMYISKSNSTELLFPKLSIRHATWYHKLPSRNFLISSSSLEALTQIPEYQKPASRLPTPSSMLEAMILLQRCLLSSSVSSKMLMSSRKKVSIKPLSWLVLYPTTLTRMDRRSWFLLLKRCYSFWWDQLARELLSWSMSPSADVFQESQDSLRTGLNRSSMSNSLFLEQERLSLSLEELLLPVLVSSKVLEWSS